MQLEINDIKLSTTDTSNMENNSEIWFSNKSTNKTISDSEKEGNSDEDKLDMEIEMLRIEQMVSLMVCKKKENKIKKNK